MKRLTSQLSTILLGLVFISFFSSCEEDERNEVMTFPKGTFEAEADKNAIMAGETVTFVDKSTRVHERTWTFVGGEPSSSTDSVVEVTYPNAGSYSANLFVRFVDNQTESENFQVDVEGVEPTYEATLGIFVENPDIDPKAETNFAIYNGFTSEISNEDPFEGEELRIIKDNGSGSWAMGAISPVEITDISAYADGYYIFAMKSTSEGTLQIRLTNTSSDYAAIDLTPGLYGFHRDGEWHEIIIPISDFVAVYPELDLTQIRDFMVFRNVGTPTDYNNYEFHLDNFYLAH